nr:hypothetical protein Itr_chr06CG07730 [Ipomoea trifida]
MTLKTSEGQGGGDLGNGNRLPTATQPPPCENMRET